MTGSTRQKVMDAVGDEEISAGLRAALLSIATSIDEGHRAIEAKLDAQRLASAQAQRMLQTLIIGIVVALSAAAFGVTFR